MRQACLNDNVQFFKQKNAEQGDLDRPFSWMTLYYAQLLLAHPFNNILVIRCLLELFLSLKLPVPLNLFTKFLIAILVRVAFLNLRVKSSCIYLYAYLRNVYQKHSCSKPSISHIKRNCIQNLFIKNVQRLHKHPM